jgi:hypothetical protein
VDRTLKAGAKDKRGLIIEVVSNKQPKDRTLKAGAKDKRGLIIETLNNNQLNCQGLKGISLIMVRKD